MHTNLLQFTSDTTRFTVTVCTPNSFLSTIATRPSGPNAAGSAVVPAE